MLQHAHQHQCHQNLAATRSLSMFALAVMHMMSSCERDRRYICLENELNLKCRQIMFLLFDQYRRTQQGNFCQVDAQRLLGAVVMAPLHFGDT